MDDYQEEIQIPEFPLTEKFDKRKSFIIHCIGAPGSGKTHFINFVAYERKHVYPVGVVMCQSENTQGAFTPIFGGAFTTSEYNERKHKMLSNRQKLTKKEGCDNNLCFKVIDDFGGSKNGGKSDTIAIDHKVGSQHYGQLLIMGYQTVQDIPDDIQNTPTFVVIFLEKDDGNRRRLHKKYFKTYIPEYADFSNLMNDICKKHTCLIVDFRKQSSDLQECVFWYKAPAWDHGKDEEGETIYKGYPPGFRFGCKQFQQWSDLRFDPNAIPGLDLEDF